jgi:hypothetical protein
MNHEPIVAVGLLTQTQVKMLGPALRRVFALPEDGRFDNLLAALDRERCRSDNVDQSVANSDGLFRSGPTAAQSR